MVLGCFPNLLVLFGYLLFNALERRSARISSSKKQQAGGEDGPRDYLRCKGKDYKVSDLRLKHASDFNTAAKDNYGKVHRAMSRGGSQAERKEHFRRKGDSKPEPKRGPRALSLIHI